jgi:predicted DNA-binding protein/uncharacterized protein (DUF433 family)
MPASETKLLSVRLPEAEKRRIKILAASEGLTIAQAIHEAFDAWVAHLQSRKRAPEARGTSAAGDSEKPSAPSRAATPKHDQRPAHGTPSSTPGGGPIHNLGVTSRAWLSRAAQLDWSKCLAVESAQGRSGKIWVVRGTDAPLAEVLHAVAEGHPLLEIAEVCEITLQQLIAVLQFTAESAAPASPGR